MLGEHDAEDVKQRVDAALATLDAAVGRFGGRREKFIGDAVFAVFGYPNVHDDDALRAGLCALATTCEPTPATASASRIAATDGPRRRLRRNRLCMPGGGRNLAVARPAAERCT